LAELPFFSPPCYRFCATWTVVPGAALSNEIGALHVDIGAVRSEIGACNYNVKALVEIMESHRDVMNAMKERLIFVDQSLTELLKRGAP
jgi:hypothetical protein